MTAAHRRRLGARHLILLALLALLGSAGAFAAVTGSASAHPSPSSPRVTDPTDSHTHGGPALADFADIRRARPDARPPRNLPSASTGTFTARCGRNENGHRNPDNFIVTPGVRNGAHHLHDYVGNLSTDAFSTDGSLRAAGTTCARGDKSAYFWPVLRLTGDSEKEDEAADEERTGDGNGGNSGRVLTPDSVALTFRGNPTAKVTAMPEGLRAITGDAKAFTNGAKDARARWSCTGFADRHLTDKYPLCPRGSAVVRLLDFPSCWDGQHGDSAGHRAHLVFPDAATGRCGRRLTPVPQLRMELTYSVPRGPSFAVDSFPEQLRKPVTDHADFANVMPAGLMATVVRCVNDGRRCG
ncbi:DUF1996 domain-containing protein [Streptomyces sp. UNOB3_S3]|uniref:DUF1996 domain-containing protein n=1 Tax=Streptomyces sp. UNOB3_S3 TaxID=2871682 RepID=UPI001E5B2D0E|nr:DUF1996 domain-containing protein [Streptomyces sp. UNOB3_S3]MCC3777599.1 DUF1996 domain-containing protein [Streptomyces sp. UNOB3_S3]